MVSGVQLKQHVLGTIDARRDDIIGVGESIMDAPELGFKETKTAGRVAQFFETCGLPLDEGLALTGVKAVLRGGKPGPTVALMGELDALLVPDHPRANSETGAAHACGHNAQIAGLMGAMMGKMDMNFAMYMQGVNEMYDMGFTDGGGVIEGGDFADGGDAAGGGEGGFMDGGNDPMGLDVGF